MEKPEAHQDIDAKRRLTTIVAADICGYSSASEKDEILAIETADMLFQVFETTCATMKGRVFKRIADGFLAEFPSTYSAVTAALNFRDYVQSSEKKVGSPAVRLGIHVGDVIDRPDGDVLGHGVNVSVRLQELAEPNGILVSQNVINLIGENVAMSTHSRGSVMLKNISQSIQAYDIDHADVKIITTFVTKLRLLLLGLIALLLILVAAYAFQANKARTRISADHKVDEIIQNQFPASQQTEGNSGVSAEYIRGVLESLQRTKTPGHQASFALLDAGNIGLAIEKLETSLKDTAFGSEPYINTMHQIAALSYYHDSAKAVAYYETLLELNPKDTRAMVSLVKAYQVRLEADKAFELYQAIIDKQIGTPYEKLRIQIDMAFNHILQLEFPIAIETLDRIGADIKALGDRRLFIEWQFLFGYSQVRTGNLDEGEAMLIASVTELNQIGADANLPRAYNALGQVYERRAERETELTQTHLETALTHYQKQYETGQIINKTRELPEALYAMGEVYLKLEDHNAARQKFLEALNVARTHNYVTSERRARTGLARIAKINGDEETVCRQMKKIITLYQKNPSVKLTSRTLETLEGLGCGFNRSDI